MELFIFICTVLFQLFQLFLSFLFATIINEPFTKGIDQTIFIYKTKTKEDFEF